MRILFEDYQYNAETLKGILPEKMLSFADNDTKAKTTYVGYHHSVELGDAVFILPKVFVDKDGHPFGKPEETVESYLNKSGTLLDIVGEDDAKIVSNLSFWIYSAIARYRDNNPDTGILERRDIQEVESVGDYGCSTLIDIIQSLRKYNRDHQTLVTFIVNNNRSVRNKISWNKTVRKIQPIIQDDSPIYLEFIGKNKSINFDEEIIVIFYSVLEYLKEKYFFSEPMPFGFNLIPTWGIENIIDEGAGTIMLNKIRHKYFTDELVQLWRLLYVFFDKAEKIEAKDYMDEYVLAKNFNLVFEDMVDQLVGSEDLADLKKNKDNKIIDHLYKDDSLLNNGKVYYIADSKYYKESTDLGETSVYKQFTYARNIIQHNLDLFHKDPKDIRYLPAMRDELTEGYNVVPNYFIRGTAVDGEKGKLYDYDRDELHNEYDEDKKNKDNKLVNYHFHNRLFDRDTLVLQTYSINFLYVLAKYIEGPDEVVKRHIQKEFRKDLINRFNGLYSFYKLVPIKEPLDQLVERHFKLLHGKIYRPYENQNYIVLALEASKVTGENAGAFDKENLELLDRISKDFKKIEFVLTEDLDLDNVPEKHDNIIPYDDNEEEGEFLMAAEDGSTNGNPRRDIFITRE